jgi:hypothetical protein
VCLLPQLTWSRFPAWTSWEPSDLTGLEPDDPPPPLNCLWPPLTWSNLPVWLSQEPFDVREVNPDSSLCLLAVFPWVTPELHLKDGVCLSSIVQCSHSAHLIIIFCDIVSSIPFLSEHYHCCISDPGNVFQVFQSWFLKICNNNHIGIKKSSHITRPMPTSVSP